MPPDGVETLARWREVGQWWASEPQLEIHRFIDGKGIRRQKEKQLAPLTPDDTKVATPYEEDFKEEICLRIQRARDDKVAKACGLLPDQDLSDFIIDPGKQRYAALHAFSGYAFGKSTFIAPELPAVAGQRGYKAVLIADPFSLVGAVEFCKTANTVGVHPLVGASFEMEGGGSLVLVAQNHVGWKSLSHLISACHLEEPRLHPLCNWQRLERFTAGLLCLSGGDAGPINRLLIQKQYDHAKSCLERCIGIYSRENVFVEIERTFLPWEITVNKLLLELSRELRLTSVAGGQITHSRPEHFIAQDTLVCIETLCLIDEVVGRKQLRDETQKQIKQPPQRALNAERYMRSATQMEKLYADLPELLSNTEKIIEKCEKDVLPSRTELPPFCDNEPAALRTETYINAQRLHGLITRNLKRRLDFELDRIIRNGFAGHFLVAWDMCQWSREQGILLSGRGSVVDSAVAYCLGLSRIDAYKHDLHFDRFLPEDGSKRPDIDIDFEARRRDDVRNYLVSKYGQEHVATVGAIGTFFTRGIVREVGKVMGIPQHNLDYLIKRLHGSVSPSRLEQAIDAKPELRDSGIPRERFHWVFKLADLMMDLPRNLRSHSSGVIISRNPIADTVPVMQSAVDGVRIIQWDKRSAKRCFDKFDVLCLRGNDVLSDTEDRVRTQKLDFRVEELSTDDPEPYRAMRAGELIGVPQSASPAMRQAHIRLGTKDLGDARLVQAGIRPGVGGAVKLNELIARRKGKPYSFSHPELEKILGPTYGIIVFQEQVDMLLQTFAGYSSGEAEEAREAIHKRRKEDYVLTIEDQVISRIIKHGFSSEIAREVYDFVAIFKGYGFAEGHALAFADISVRCIWCQQNYPAEYFSALLDAQPAGYYGPCTLVNEARNRGVRILPPNINRSEIKFSVEDVQAEEDPKVIFPNGGIRVALSQIKGLSKPTIINIVDQRIRNGAYTSLFDFAARVKPNRDELETLILCGALETLHENLRATLWAVPEAQNYAATSNVQEGALALTLKEPNLPAGIQDFSEEEKAIYQRSLLDLDVANHLMSFERARVSTKGIITSAEAGRLTDRNKAYVVGNPIRLRFPPTQSGKRVVFFDLEDESGLLNVTCFDDTYVKYGHTIVCSPYVTILGEAQHRDNHVAFLAQQVFPYKPCITQRSQNQPSPVVTGDYLVR
jgi:error-prone DNA polymerase